MYEEWTLDNTNNKPRMGLPVDSFARSGTP